MLLEPSFVIWRGFYSASLRWYNLAELHLKIFHTLIHAKLSSGRDKPLELLLVSLPRTLLLLCVCFCHTATQ